MQRKPTYYFRKSFAAVLAAAAGLVAGTQVPTSHEATSRDTTRYFVMQAYASDAFVPFFTGPQPVVTDDRDRADSPRECASGIDSDCIYQ
jgi:hypothetical protein